MSLEEKNRRGIENSSPPKKFYIKNTPRLVCISCMPALQCIYLLKEGRQFRRGNLICGFKLYIILIP